VRVRSVSSRRASSGDASLVVDVIETEEAFRHAPTPAVQELRDAAEVQELRP
jgi:hypothetical protein